MSTSSASSAVTCDRARVAGRPSTTCSRAITESPTSTEKSDGVPSKARLQVRPRSRRAPVWCSGHAGGTRGRTRIARTRRRSRTGGPGAARRRRPRRSRASTSASTGSRKSSSRGRVSSTLISARSRVVSARVPDRTGEHCGRLPAEHGDALDAVGVDGRRVEAEEARLADRVARCVEAVHADVVERHGAVHCRRLGRFRQRQRHRHPQRRSFRRGSLSGARRATPSAVPATGTELRIFVASTNLVLARPDEREVVVGEPVEERRRLGDVGGVDDRGRILTQARRQALHPLAHRCPVVDGGSTSARTSSSSARSAERTRGRSPGRSRRAR